MSWIKKYWYIPFTIITALLGSIAGALLQRRLTNPADRVKDELRAIDAAAVAAEQVQRHGIEHTRKMVEEVHRDTLKEMDNAAERKRQRLADDPVALTKHLVRTASRSRRERASRDQEG